MKKFIMFTIFSALSIMPVLSVCSITGGACNVNDITPLYPDYKYEQSDEQTNNFNIIQRDFTTNTNMLNNQQFGNKRLKIKMFHQDGKGWHEGTNY